jgi:hypothetical protein
MRKPFDDPWLDEAALGTVARETVAQAEPWRDVSMLSDFELVRMLRERLGPSLFWRETEFGAHESRLGESTPAEADVEDLVEKHDVGFAVLDGNGEPYGGLDYLLFGPGSEEEEGTLADNGELHRKRVSSEDYRLVLRDIADAAWGVESVCAKISVTVTASVVGYDEGTELEVRLFRQFAEADDEVLATLSAVVHGSTASATWTYEHDSEGPFATDQGVVEIVAEVRASGTGPWAKTLVPLALQLPTVDDAAWSDDEVSPGEPVTLGLSAIGVPSGTPIAIEIYKCRRSGEELLLESFPDLKVEGDRVEVVWVHPPAEEGAPPIEAECFFIATLDGDPNRITVSNMLTVSTG